MPNGGNSRDRRRYRRKLAGISNWFQQGLVTSGEALRELQGSLLIVIDEIAELTRESFDNLAFYLNNSTQMWINGEYVGEVQDVRVDGQPLSQQHQSKELWEYASDAHHWSPSEEDDIVDLIDRVIDESHVT